MSTRRLMFSPPASDPSAMIVAAQRICAVAGVQRWPRNRWQRHRSPEQPPLSQGRSQVEGAAVMIFGLDAFGEDCCAGGLGVGGDRRDDSPLVVCRRTGDQGTVELDDIGGDDRQQGQRIRVLADIVECDTQPESAGADHRPE